MTRADAWTLTVAVGVVAAWAWFRISTGVVLEDALITFRHAENVAAGLGYGFNPGEWVQGSTTPLLTLLLALVALVAPSAVPAAAVVIGVTAGACTAALIADLLRRWGCHPAVQALAIGGWSLGPRVIWSGAGGMETPLVAAFMALSLWAAERQRGGLLGLALALLLLTRPDTVLWVALMLAAAARSPDLLRSAAPSTGLVVAWWAFATWAFGNPLPHSVMAKAVVNPREGDLISMAALTRRLEWFADAWSAPVPALPPLAWALVAVGFVLAWRHPRRLWRVPASFTIALVVAYHLTRTPPFFWCPVPAAWTATLTGACALQWAFDRLPGWARRGAWVLVPAALLGGVRRLDPVARETREIQQNELEMRAAAGRWLAAHTPPDASVAMEAIGYQGTLSQRRVIDLAGLISPRVLAIAREEPNNARRFARVLAEETPHAVLLRHWEVKQNLHFHGGPLFETAEAKRSFHERYREAARFTAPHPEHMRRNHTVVIYVLR